MPNKAILAKGLYKNRVSIFNTTNSKISSYNNNKNLAILSTYTINNNSIEELDSNNNLDLIDPNLEELEEDSIIPLEENIEDNTSNNNSIIINNNNNNSNSNEELIINNNTIELVYNRLGYISLKAIKHLTKNTKGINYIKLDNIKLANISLDNYIICIQAKLTKNCSTEPSTKVEGYLDLIYIDIGRPIMPKTFRGFKYYITFRDAYSKYLVVKLLKTRKDIVIVIKETITEIELEAKNNSNLETSSSSNSSNTSNSSNSSNSSNLEISNTTYTSKPSYNSILKNLESSNIINTIKAFNNNKVKALQLDNEFKSKELTSYLTSKGIKTRFSSLYTPK